jgi:RecA/RadA recombinase
MSRGKEFTFEDLNKEMSKISTYGDTLDKSSISEIDDYIPSGNYLLNACLTGSVFGGYPNNRSVCIAGPSGTGKTFLVLNAIKQAQEKGYYIVFYDSENAVDRPLVQKFGIDPGKFRYEPCNTVQEFRSSITSLADTLIEQKTKGNEIPKVMIILDSAGNLATQKEIDDARSGSDKADMTRAKLLKSTFRILMTKLGIIKAPFIFTNHTYQTQDLFSKTVAGGGTGPEYAASIIMFLGKAKLKEGAEQTGIIFTAKPNKNRFAKPIPIKFHLDFNKGMNPYVGIQDFISWENCGIERGRYIGEREYEKMSPSDQAKCHRHEFNDGESDKVIYFVPSDSARNLCVKHLNDVVKLNELFTPKVITEEVLRELDENVIKRTFAYGVDENDEFDIDAIETEDLEDSDE